MGLAEKRALETIKTEFSAWEKTVKGDYPFLSFEVDWDLLATNGAILEVAEVGSMSRLILNRISEALADICQDEMGKTALKEKVKKIKIIPRTGEMNFDNGVFTIESSTVLGEGAWDSGSLAQSLGNHL